MLKAKEILMLNPVNSDQRIRPHSAGESGMIRPPNPVTFGQGTWPQLSHGYYSV